MKSLNISTVIICLFLISLLPGITIIGKTHALKSFGKRIVDAALCIKEANNQYYSCAAPRQYYDKNALVYMKLEQIEDEDK